MIETIKDDEGRVLALLVWQLFDEEHAIDEDGKILGIIELFIHPSLDGVAVMKQFNEMILPQAPNAERCVYYRQGEKRTFDRIHFERMARS